MRAVAVDRALCICMCFGIVLLFLGTVTAVTRIVDDDGGGWADFTTVQDAVDASSNGDRIRIFTGTYVENVDVDVPVTIIGNGTGAVTIDGDGSGDSLLLSADWINVSGLRTSQADGYPNAGIHITGDNCNVSGVLTRDNYFGIFIDGATDCAIHSCEVRDNYGSGIHLQESHGNTIWGNTIVDNNLVTPSDADLIGEWSMDEASWTGTPDEVTDTSGSDLHGTSSGGVDTSATSIAGRSGRFDGSDDLVTVGDDPALDITTEMTLEAWMYAEGDVASGDIHFPYFEFDYSSSAYPDILHLDGRLYAVLYTGPGSDGFVRTLWLSDNGVIEVADSYEFDNSYGGYPSAVKVTDGIIAVAYQGPGNDGFLATIGYSSDGTITTPVINSVEFHTSDGRTPDIIHVSGDVYAIAFRGPGSDGFIITYEIASDGTITTPAIDQYEYDTSSGEYPDMVHVAGDVFAVVYQGASDDGFVRTIEIASDGTITTPYIDSYEFDTTYTGLPRIVQVSGDTFAVTHRSSSLQGYLRTLDIASNGTISGQLDSLVFDSNMCYAPVPIHMTGDIFAVVYRGPGDDGWTVTLDIPSNGDLSAGLTDRFEFEPSTAIYGEPIRLADGMVAVAFRGPGSDGFISTFAIDGSGTMSGHRAVLEASSAYESSAVHVSGEVYAVAFRGAFSTGRLVTVTIADNGTMGAVVDTVFFQDEYAVNPNLIHISGTTYAIAHTGPGNLGDLITIDIAADGNIGASPLDSYRFDTSYCYKPDLLHVSGDIYAVAYEGRSSDGYVRTLEIASNGTIAQSAVDSYEFHTSNGRDPSIAHVSGDVYILAFRSGGNDGFVRTFDMASDGNIGGTIDTYEFDTSNGYDPDIIHIAGDTYAVAYQGSGSDGFIRTIEVETDGDIDTPYNDSLEYDTSAGRTPDIFRIDGDTFGIAYRGSSDDGFVRTMDIAVDGSISAVVDTLEFDTSDGGEPCVLMLSSGVYAAFYRGGDIDGKVASMDISDAGAVGGVIDTLAFEADSMRMPRFIHISGDVYAIAYTGANSAGFVSTITMDSDGKVSSGPIDRLMFEAGTCYEPSIVHVSGDHFAIAYRGPDNDGFVTTVEISTDGSIPGMDDVLEFTTAECYEPSIVHVSGEYFAVAFRGNGNDGFIVTLEISSTGMILSTVDILEFDTVDGYWPDIVHVAGDTFAVAARGQGGDGFVTTVGIATDGTISGVIDALEFDTSECNYPDLFHVTANLFAVAYRGSGNDGFIRSFTIYPNGTLGPTLDTFEFDTSECAHPEVVLMSGSLFAIAYQGSGSDGFVTTIMISSDGAISDPYLDRFEFDVSEGREPCIVRLSSSNFAVAYRGSYMVGYVISGGLIDLTGIKGITKSEAYGIHTDTGLAYCTLNGNTLSGPVVPGWNHVAMTYDRTALSDQHRLYINGILVDTANGNDPIDTNSADLRMGDSFWGYIDEVRLHDAALDPDVLRADVSAGIHLWLSENNTIAFNDIDGNRFGIRSEGSWNEVVRNNNITSNTYSGILYTRDCGDNSVLYNIIDGNGDGIVVNGTGNVNATRNYWGSPGGPSGSGPGSGDSVSGNVDYGPWYATVTTTPSREFHNLSKGSTDIALSDSISGVMSAAEAGDVLTIGAGTFSENIVISVSMTVRGGGSTVSTISPAAGDTVTVSAANVRIDNLTLSGSGDTIVAGSQPGLVIRDSVITSTGGFAVNVTGAQDVNASYNHWGTISQSVIESGIYDSNDNPVLGTVSIAPWYNAAMDTLFTPDGDPPTTSMTIGDPNFGTDPILVLPTTRFTLTADDGAGSGVNITVYHLDGGAPVTYTNPFAVAALGDHTIGYYSIDLLGNVEAVHTLNITVDDTVPSSIYPDLQLSIATTPEYVTLIDRNITVIAGVYNYGNFTRTGDYTYTDPETGGVVSATTDDIFIIFEYSDDGAVWTEFAYRRIDSSDVRPGGTGVGMANHMVTSDDRLEFRATIWYEPNDATGQYEPTNALGARIHPDTEDVNVALIAEKTQTGTSFMPGTAALAVAAVAASAVICHVRKDED